MIDRVCVAVATCLYLSYIPFGLLKDSRWARLRRWTGAGLIGSLVGWGALYALPEGPGAFAGVYAAAAVLACFVSWRAEKFFGQEDDSRIIIDEVVGFWAAAALLPREPALLLGALVLFRIFDAWKGPLRRLERVPYGVGVVLDDVAAGAAANLLLRGLLIWRPGLFG